MPPLIKDKSRQWLSRIKTIITSFKTIILYSCHFTVKMPNEPVINKQLLNTEEGCYLEKLNDNYLDR